MYRKFSYLILSAKAHKTKKGSYYTALFRLPLNFFINFSAYIYYVNQRANQQHIHKFLLIRSFSGIQRYLIIYIKLYSYIKSRYSHILNTTHTVSRFGPIHLFPISVLFLHIITTYLGHGEPPNLVMDLMFFLLYIHLVIVISYVICIFLHEISI